MYASYENCIHSLMSHEALDHVDRLLLKQKRLPLCIPRLPVSLCLFASLPRFLHTFMPLCLPASMPPSFQSSPPPPPKSIDLQICRVPDSVPAGKCSFYRVSCVLGCMFLNLGGSGREEGRRRLCLQVAVCTALYRTVLLVLYHTARRKCGCGCGCVPSYSTLSCL